MYKMKHCIYHSIFQLSLLLNEGDVVSGRIISSVFSVQENDPLLGSSPLRGKAMTLEGGTYGGFPIKFLVLVVSDSLMYLVTGGVTKRG